MLRLIFDKCVTSRRSVCHNTINRIRNQRIDELDNNTEDGKIKSYVTHEQNDFSLDFYLVKLFFKPRVCKTVYQVLCGFQPAPNELPLGVAKQGLVWPVSGWN